MTVTTKKTWTATQLGIGKPDYSKEIGLGQDRPGFTLKYNQSLKNFGLTFSDIASPYPYVVPKLGAGEIKHVIDADTGLDMPYTVAEGYTLESISGVYSYTQNAIIRCYVDTYLFINAGVLNSGNVFYQAEVIGIGSHIIDPTGSTSHLFDLQVENLGDDDLEGTVGFFFVLEAVGTPPLPKTKTVRCKYCGCERTVPNETKNWICPECGQLNIFLNLKKFKRTL